MPKSYKMPWFVRRGSSAPAHTFVFSKALVWSVLNLSPSLLSTVADSFSVQPIRFAHTPCIHAHIQTSVSYHNILFSNMHSYETLALLALVASTASPALSAPVLEGQHQARSDVEERASAIPGGLGDLVKTVGTGLAFGALPAVLGNVLGGNSTRRDLPARIIFDGLPVNTGDSTTDTSTSTTPANIIFDGLPVGVKRGSH
ncbi:hypothetical protein BJY52DRAFT_456926 [Lactarius psammicola]|nr:hypothetical protein BJY52DRAFT_456926 [Lactarius psammicola]